MVGKDAVFIILIVLLNTVFFDFVYSRYDSCDLPKTLHGEWFSREDGLNNFITVKSETIQGRGRCVEYLNTNNDNFTILLHHDLCYHCIRILVRTLNVLEKTETGCVNPEAGEKPTIQSICKYLDPNKELITWFSKNPTLKNCRSSLEGVWKFAYQNQFLFTGECQHPEANITACQTPGSQFYIENQQYIMNYRHCEGVAETQDAEVQYKCLGDWYVGKNHFWAVLNARESRIEEAYRCFLANRDDDFYISVSITAECNTLKTAQGGPERLHLEPVKAENVPPRCKFPDNFTGVWINTANFDAEVVINATHIVERWKPDQGREKEQVYVCHERRDSRFVLARMGINGCQKDFMCFDFVPRHHNIIRYRKDTVKDSGNLLAHLHWVTPNTQKSFLYWLEWTSCTLDGRPDAIANKLCANHLTCPEQADSHYKAVCRALVAEVLELTSFLENISNRTQVLPYSEEDEVDSKTLEKLRIQDWARLWMQVIQQLRQGVKLKKIDPAQIHHPIEYALTPYEMLLDDIRSRRYKLRQVMVNGDIPPRVKKDAHALILDFIRSRPPLVPVSKRKLPPTPPRQLTLYEKLMASIKQQPKLKPTPPNTGEMQKRKIETSRTKLEDSDDTPQPQRRLIKADISLGFGSSYEDLDDLPLSPSDDPFSLPSQNDHSVSTVTKSVSQTDSLCSERRHSISVCESPPKTCDQTPQDRVIINGHYPSSNGRSSQSSRSDYWYSSQWQSLECLSLTLEEVVHIRNVLTKAELESLIVEPALYEDIRKGKVCFTCKEVKFSFFGPWGVKCKMCERTVCDRCSSKMRIPTEHFARIPVYMLSPTPSPPPEEESSHSFWKFTDVFGNSTVTDPATQITPRLSRQKTTVENGHAKRRLNFRHSESVYSIANSNKKGKTNPPVPATGRKRPPLQRSKTVAASETVSVKNSQEDKMKGPIVSVCRECKVMVCNIIMASQDKVSFEQRRRKNSRTWPNKYPGSAKASWK